MTLETKLGFMKQWSREEAHNCWTEYHYKYFNKYQGALFAAQTTGTSDKYIDRECKVFQRYARQWAYYRLQK